jgi:hypothetical protein
MSNWLQKIVFDVTTIHSFPALKSQAPGPAIPYLEQAAFIGRSILNEVGY